VYVVSEFLETENPAQTRRGKNYLIVRCVGTTRIFSVWVAAKSPPGGNSFAYRLAFKLFKSIY
jgi:hypothetical protein